jgi:hypothetical protein
VAGHLIERLTCEHVNKSLDVVHDLGLMLGVRKITFGPDDQAITDNPLDLGPLSTGEIRQRQRAEVVVVNLPEPLH